MTSDNIAGSNATEPPPSGYFRAFASRAVWFGAIATNMISRHSGPWSTYPLRNFRVLVGAWIITALLFGASTLDQVFWVDDIGR